MNTILFFIVLLISVSNCDRRHRRQFWPNVRPPIRFWPVNSPVDDFNINQFDEHLEPNGLNSLNALNGRPEFFSPNSDRFGRPLSFPNSQRKDSLWDGGRAEVEMTTMEPDSPTTAVPRTIHATPDGCGCSSTPQFNPVCGTDGNTYKNSGLLNCYRQCGANVEQRRMGVC